MSRRHGAFTLIELLVVISLIAILASLAMGAGRIVQAQSRRAACLSNLRQWGAALQLYVGDSNGALPRRGQGVQMVGQFDRPEDWFNALPPYIDKPPLSEMIRQGLDPKPGEHSVFVCPCADKAQKGSRAFLSYGMNMYLSPWNQTLPDNMVMIPNPTQLAFMADAPGGYASTVPSQLGYSVPARHAGSACVVFCDGHARAFKGDYLGCGKGPVARSDVRWQTLISGANQPNIK